MSSSLRAAAEAIRLALMFSEAAADHPFFSRRESMSLDALVNRRESILAEFWPYETANLLRELDELEARA